MLYCAEKLLATWNKNQATITQLAGLVPQQFCINARVSEKYSMETIHPPHRVLSNHASINPTSIFHFIFPPYSHQLFQRPPQILLLAYLQSSFPFCGQFNFPTYIGLACERKAEQPKAVTQRVCNC